MKPAPHQVGVSGQTWYCPVRDWHYVPRMNMDDWTAWDFCPGCGEAIPKAGRPQRIQEANR